MESLWIGPKDTKIEDLDERCQKDFKKYLYDHGLDQPAFVNLCRGSFPARNFIPFPGQIYKARWVSFEFGGLSSLVQSQSRRQGKEKSGNGLYQKSCLVCRA